MQSIKNIYFEVYLVMIVIPLLNRLSDQAEIWDGTSGHQVGSDFIKETKSATMNFYSNFLFCF